MSSVGFFLRFGEPVAESLPNPGRCLDRGKVPDAVQREHG